MKNEKLRSYAASKKVKLWQVGERFGLSDVAFSKKLRHELSRHDAELFMCYVDELSKVSGAVSDE